MCCRSYDWRLRSARLLQRKALQRRQVQEALICSDDRNARYVAVVQDQARWRPRRSLPQAGVRRWGRSLSAGSEGPIPEFTEVESASWCRRRSSTRFDQALSVNLSAKNQLSNYHQTNIEACMNVLRTIEGSLLHWSKIAR